MVGILGMRWGREKFLSKSWFMIDLCRNSF